MIRTFASIVILVAFTMQSALAIPGQTEKQLAAWGKSNAALTGFKSEMDQNTAGNDYQATVKVDGHTGNFSSEPVSGIVPHEYVAFPNLPAKWEMTAHLSLATDALTLVYGKTMANDFKHAERQKSPIAIWKGKRYAYATFGAVVLVMRMSDLKEALKNVHDCGALDCAGD